MASFFSDYGLMWYLEELNKKEFMKFKEVLKQEIIQYGLKQIPWTEVKKASRENLANLLVKYYDEKKAWDVTFRIFQNINRNDLSERAAREIAGELVKASLQCGSCHSFDNASSCPSTIGPAGVRPGGGGDIMLLEEGGRFMLTCSL